MLLVCCSLETSQGGKLTVELGSANGLGAVQGKHLRAEKVLSASETSGQLELVCHVGGLHDLVGPLAIDLVLLVDLEPAGADTSSLAGVIDRAVQEVGDGSGVAGRVPLNLDGVAFSGLDGLDTGGNLGAVDVASHVIGLYVGDGAVGGRHTDTDLVAGSLIVDPKLVEVLVSRGSAEQGGSDDSLGEHLEGWFG